MDEAAGRADHPLQRIMNRLSAWLMALLALAMSSTAWSLDAQRAVSTSGTPDFWARLDLSGSLEVEARYFPTSVAGADRHSNNASVALTPHLTTDWDNRDQALMVELFGRVDGQDDRRTHADLREAFYRYTARDFEWRIGVRQVFWGVTESNHLVDVINQTDFVEDVAGEASLGQPMVNLAWFTGMGTINAYLLPVFRERTFPGDNGRPRPQLPVAVDRARFPDGRGLDLALRYLGSIGAWDVGLSYFRGTNRDPRFGTEFDGCRASVTLGLLPSGPILTAPCEAGDGLPGLLDSLLPVDDVQVAIDNPVFVPVYERIDQIGLDLQFVSGALALKLEALRRRSDTEAFTAAVGGLEYTRYGLLGSDASLGLLAEYMYDSRGTLDRDVADAAATLARGGDLRFDSVDQAQRFRDRLRVQSAAVFQNDLFLGTRLALNDLAGSEVLAGVIRDLDTGALTASVTASRRIRGRYRLALTMRVFSDIPVTDIQYGFRDDDYLEMSLRRYF